MVLSITFRVTGKVTASDLRATPMARKWIVPASHSCYVECRVQLKRTRREADRSSCKWREVVYETGPYVVRCVGICNGSPGISTSTRSCSGFSHSVTIFWPDLKRLGCAPRCVPLCRARPSLCIFPANLPPTLVEPWPCLPLVLRLRFSLLLFLLTRIYAGFVCTKVTC